MKDKLIIISGANADRMGAHLNHQKYADKHGIDYKFFLRTDLENPYFTKCYSIMECFNNGYEYVLWMDDDAFFLNYEWDCTTIFTQYNEDVIVARGRGKKNGTAFFNNGVMFIRNTENMNDLFSTIPSIPWNEIEDNWNQNWGPCAGNDQPRMIYLTQTKYPDTVKVLEYPSFNAHDTTFFKYPNFLKEENPPIIHFTKKAGKVERLKKFEKTFKRIIT